MNRGDHRWTSLIRPRGAFFWQETVRPKYAARPARPAAGHRPGAGKGGRSWSGRARFAGGVIISADTPTTYPTTGKNNSSGAGTRCSSRANRWCNVPRRACGCCSGITDCLKRQMQASLYVQVDETPVRYQNPNRPGRCDRVSVDGVGAGPMRGSMNGTRAGRHAA